MVVVGACVDDGGVEVFLLFLGPRSRSEARGLLLIIYGRVPLSFQRLFAFTPNIQTYGTFQSARYINVFIVKSLVPDVPMGHIFRGIWPFWFAMVIMLVLLVFFPKIALFLPQTIVGG